MGAVVKKSDFQTFGDINTKIGMIILYPDEDPDLSYNFGFKTFNNTENDLIISVCCHAVSYGMYMSNNNLVKNFIPKNLNASALINMINNYDLES